MLFKWDESIITWSIYKDKEKSAGKKDGEESVENMEHEDEGQRK
jgi:hypothetical protein